MSDSYRDHPNEEALERFLLNTSPEEELEILESHILACGECVGLLKTLENEIAATRLALRQLLEVERILKSPARSQSRWKARRLDSTPRMVPVRCSACA